MEKCWKRKSYEQESKREIGTLRRLKIEELEHLEGKGFMETLVQFDEIYYITVRETEGNLSWEKHLFCGNLV